MRIINDKNRFQRSLLFLFCYMKFTSSFSTSAVSLTHYASLSSSRLYNVAAPNMEEQQKESSKMLEIKTLMDYKNLVVDDASHIVVVYFYAPWCRSCKAVTPQWTKLQRTLPLSVKFVKVPVIKETMLIHQGLGVPSVPFGHIYYPNVGLVEEMKLGQGHFEEFANVLKTYVKGECVIPDEEETAFE